AFLARQRLEELNTTAALDRRIAEWNKKMATATPPAPPPAAKEVQRPVSKQPPHAEPPAAKETHPAAVATPARCDGGALATDFIPDATADELRKAFKNPPKEFRDSKHCYRPGSGKTEHFNDCTRCPQMVVVPAGSFTMGSPPNNETQRSASEVQVRVSIA